MLIFKMIDESICDWILKNDNEIQKLRDKNKKKNVFIFFYYFYIWGNIYFYSILNLFYLK